MNLDHTQVELRLITYANHDADMDKKNYRAKEQSTFSISIRVDNSIKNCMIKSRGTYVIFRKHVVYFLKQYVLFVRLMPPALSTGTQAFCIAHVPRPSPPARRLASVNNLKAISLSTLMAHN